MRVSAVAVLALASFAAPAPAAGMSLRQVATLRQPMHLTQVPGDPQTLAIAERAGRVRLLRRGRLLRRPLVDLSRDVEVRSSVVEADHGGLFSLAFAPDYRRSRRLYVFYTHRDDSLRVEELRRGRRRTLLSLPARPDFDIGGQIAFDRAGRLYVGLGDQAAGGAAQNPADPRGKLLRIRPARPGAMWQLVARGLRNPFRFSFSPGGSLLIGDVGQATTEEIDVLPSGMVGANFGWNVFEGDGRVGPGDVPGHLPPVIQHGHAQGFCSITGGLLVRDRALPIRGRYLYSDFCRGQLRSARVSRSGASGDRGEPLAVSRPVAFAEDARRRVYVVSLRGPVFRLSPR